MSEVVVVAIITAAPGNETAVQELAASVIADTHAEDGCVTYALHRDVNDPARFVYIERWASMETLAVHGASPHIARFREALPALAGAPSEILVLEPIAHGEPSKGTLAG